MLGLDVNELKFKVDPKLDFAIISVRPLASIKLLHCTSDFSYASLFFIGNLTRISMQMETEDH